MPAKVHAEPTDEQQAVKLQQQLLLLAARQAKDLTAAYPQVQEDENQREAMFNVFMHEMDKLAREVSSLASAVCVSAACCTIYLHQCTRRELQISLQAG